MEKIRNDYFDNIKSVLITLVVIGHFLLPLESTRLKDGLVNVIYLFHMPMFIMVSGYFAKGMYAGKRFRWERIGKLLWLYLLFQIISERSERASVIISTNLEFSQWTQLFENEMLLAALIDRVTFRSFVLNMNCSSSYRIDSTLNHD